MEISSGGGFMEKLAYFQQFLESAFKTSVEFLLRYAD